MSAAGAYTPPCVPETHLEDTRGNRITDVKNPDASVILNLAHCYGRNYVTSIEVLFDGNLTDDIVDKKRFEHGDQLTIRLPNSKVDASKNRKLWINVATKRCLETFPFDYTVDDDPASIPVCSHGLTVFLTLLVVVLGCAVGLAWKKDVIQARWNQWWTSRYLGGEEPIERGEA